MTVSVPLAFGSRALEGAIAVRSGHVVRPAEDGCVGKPMGFFVENVDNSRGDNPQVEVQGFSLALELELAAMADFAGWR